MFIIPNATDRMTLYFAGVALIVQANLPQLWRTMSEQVTVRLAIIILNVIAMSVFLFAGNKASSFVPYQWVLSADADPARGVYVPEEFEE